MSPVPSIPLRVATVQARAVPGDVAHNAAHAATLAATAAADGAQLVVFPELHLCGYHLAALATDHTAEVAADQHGHVRDERLRPLTARAGGADVAVLLGAAVRRPDGRLTNSLILSVEGRCQVVYDKAHLWHDENTLFTAGGTAADLDVGPWRIGLGICYDMSFPEHARAAAVRGAHLYVAASAFAAGAEHRAAIYLASRALENTIYCAFINPVGGPEHRPCRGGTAVWGPGGARLADAGGDIERVLLTDLDPGQMTAARKGLRMLAEHRRQSAAPTDPSVAESPQQRRRFSIS
ncbi:carbon-nitrogen hydrolase family protein [Pilimelia columellifera]|uniref:Carbon-nitrogen hydrolase n=1 Tax=Pilimelia columellifera subsp. columellifera TaxID=706583 RepID=A0ABN3MZ70_9ACTN